MQIFYLILIACTLMQIPLSIGTFSLLREARHRKAVKQMSKKNAAKKPSHEIEYEYIDGNKTRLIKGEQKEGTIYKTLKRDVILYGFISILTLFPILGAILSGIFYYLIDKNE